MSQINPKNKDFQFFIEVWKKSHQISQHHITWAQTQCKIISTRRHHNLSGAVSKSHYFYFVCRGILAHCIFLPSGRRKILSLGFPGAGLSTTIQLYSPKRISGDIFALRSGAVVAIPHSSLRANSHEDAAIQTLISILVCSQLHLLYKLRNVCWSLIPSERYRQFTVLLADVNMLTSQNEQADLLGISRSCIQQQKRKLLCEK